VPEGAEVKRCGELLSSIIGAKMIKEIVPVSGKLMRNWVDPQLSGLHVHDILVKGKVIFIRFDPRADKCLVSTLGMSGWWYPSLESLTEDQRNVFAYVRGKSVKVVDVIASSLKHTRVRIDLTDGSSAHYVDPRNFGNLKVLSEAQAKVRFTELGKDPLGGADDSELTDALLYGCRKVHKPIGEILLDQSIIAGIGNIYRAEALFLAGIHPARTCRSLTLQDIEKIAKASSVVLKIAYHCGGAMSYPPEAINPFFIAWKFVKPINRHLVYGCSHDIYGNLVESCMVGGRRVWYSPARQILPPP